MNTAEQRKSVIEQLNNAKEVVKDYEYSRAEKISDRAT